MHGPVAHADLHSGLHILPDLDHEGVALCGTEIQQIEKLERRDPEMRKFGNSIFTIRMKT